MEKTKSKIEKDSDPIVELRCRYCGKLLDATFPKSVKERDPRLFGVWREALSRECCRKV